LLEIPFPQNARELAERVVDQAREAYARSSGTLEAAAQVMEKSLDVASRTAAALNRKIIAIAEKNLDSGFDLARSVSGARRFSDIVELQAAYWRKQYDALNTQVEEIRNLLFGFGITKPKTTEPLPGSKKAPSPAQQTPKKRTIRVVGDRALKTLKQPDRQPLEASPPAAPSAGPTVPPPEGQVRSRKKVSPDKKPKGLQKSPKHDPATQAEQQRPASSKTRKAQPPSGPIALAEVRTVGESQANSKNKSAADKPDAQSDVTGVKFGMLDGNAVRFTDLEAWWLVDGVWLPIAPGEVDSNAVVMSEARFRQAFPKVPRLPGNAFRG
jgi:Phasin protein